MRYGSLFVRVLVLAASCHFALAAELDSELRSVVDQIVLDRATTIASLQKQADEAAVALMRELSSREQHLRRLLNSGDRADRERQSINEALANALEQHRHVVNLLAERDKTFAAEIAEFRRQITLLAESANQRKREALIRYSAGDRVGAIDALIEIQDAQTKATELGWRDIADRALHQRNRGELSLHEAITIVNEAANRVGTYPWLWEQLQLLLRDAGRSEEARAARERAERLRGALSPQGQ